MLTRGKDGKMVESDDINLIPWFRHKKGRAAKLTEDYVIRLGDKELPFNHDDVVDIMMTAWHDAEAPDPETFVIYGIYFGLALAESQKG